MVGMLMPATVGSRRTGGALDVGEGVEDARCGRGGAGAVFVVPHALLQRGLPLPRSFGLAGSQPGLGTDG